MYTTKNNRAKLTRNFFLGGLLLFVGLVQMAIAATRGQGLFQNWGDILNHGFFVLFGIYVIVHANQRIKKLRSYDFEIDDSFIRGHQDGEAFSIDREKELASYERKFDKLKLHLDGADQVFIDLELYKFSEEEIAEVDQKLEQGKFCKK
ncbi:hypothetical protein KFE98_02120 [bacterium SCSIO 12741]|nr:hypothetical protein KFE98_02120 [bacterium SCSIO 12741]